MRLDFTIGDTHFHAIQRDTKQGEDGNSKTVCVFACDLLTGRMHTGMMSETEVTLVLAVACVGEERDLPARMYKDAETALQGFPDWARPIP